ncbi:hypothetical protein MO973_05300 [Paenibacillus sp. TRM 82003]|nr:hypothetical protein [Paenibacillus sp. TRM 82003]
MSAIDVLEEIKRLRSQGGSLNKKKIKASHPQLIRNALYYFPSWDHAVQSADA